MSAEYALGENAEMVRCDCQMRYVVRFRKSEKTGKWEPAFFDWFTPSQPMPVARCYLCGKPLRPLYFGAAADWFGDA